MDRYLVLRRRRWEAADLRLRERGPYELLKRGYAIAYDSSGAVIRSMDQVATGDSISVRLARGQIDAEVRNKKTISE
jgi:exodeoxyribonuclease VII large subunit